MVPNTAVIVLEKQLIRTDKCDDCKHALIRILDEVCRYCFYWGRLPQL